MRVIDARGIEPAAVVEEGATHTTIRQVITADMGAPTFAMRMFEIQPGGHTPYHSHAWEHEVFILDGSGQVESESGPVALAPRTAVFVAPGEPHQFVNSGQETLRFLCLIPVQQACLAVEDEAAQQVGR